ncbi:hypothetical protein DB29_03890 [Shouchella clausii]|nr:hypothetical protein DB29_03890 [Shouchella clausii]
MPGMPIVRNGLNVTRFKVFPPQGKIGVGNKGEKQLTE